MSTDVLKPEVPVDEVSEVDEEPHIFMRLEKEDAWCFHCFATYRDLPPDLRSIAEVARVLKASLRPMYDRAKRFEWEVRALAWDDYCDKVARSTRLNEIKAMNERHINDSVAVQKILMTPVSVYVKRMKEQGFEKSFENLSAADLLELIFKSADKYPKSAQLERTARGEASMITKTELTGEQSINIKEVRFNVVKTETTVSS